MLSNRQIYRKIRKEKAGVAGKLSVAHFGCLESIPLPSSSTIGNGEKNEEITPNPKCLRDKLSEWAVQHRPKCLLTTTDQDVSTHSTHGSNTDILIKIMNNVQELSNTVIHQNKVILEALSEQKVLTSVLILKTFPVLQDDGIEDLEKKILPENREQYVESLKLIINGNLKKNIRQILGDDIIKNFNLDGTHGKKSIKFFRANF